MANVGLEQIEAAVLAFIKSKWPATAAPIVDFDISAEPMSIATPGIYAAAHFSALNRCSHRVFTGTVMVQVFLIFSHLSGPKDRRSGAHQLVRIIMQLLKNQELGLDMEPLVPIRCPEITDADLRKANKIGFRLDMQTKIDVGNMTEEEALDLLSIHASYYLKPDDDVVDAQDNIEL